MAPKRPSPLDEPPAASSSEEEETSSGEEEEGMSRDGSSSEDEEDEEETQAQVQTQAQTQTQTQTQKPKKLFALPSTPVVEKKTAPKKSELASNSVAQSSSSESGSGSDTDSDTESGGNVKPIASKPMEETPKVKKPRSKPSTSATPVARSSLKRPIETIRDGKRPKKSSEADADDGVVAEDDSKKSVDESKKLFQRLWSEDDEIAILNGIIEYSAKKGADPALDMNAFHDFIKKSLHVDVTRVQLVDKVRRLRKKYRNNVDRGKKGADPTFSKAHDRKGFELSKKIWGGEGIIRTSVVEQPKPNANGTPKKNQRGNTSKSLASLKVELLPSPEAPKEDDKMKVDDSEAPSGCMDGFVAFERSLGAVGLPESFLKPGLELIGQSKRTELEEEWKKLHLAELELFLKRTELIRDQTKLILDAYKSSSK
ncbi:probable transcription factor At1g61730 [Benincasa hispida]|uniref:probable transcription factor At1g61730 n=1 Tax=Benincasa hispida TaxID=102211 RepID=UPI001901DC6D|nr:probable transcription factor At1g61730 [Benincasa hispida]XP_038882181.1 probable transcription factor At1g61730 [Benincasa hispida]